MFALNFSQKSIEQLKKIKKDQGLKKRLRAIEAALTKLQRNPRHPGLQTHEYHSLSGPEGKKIFEAYAENNTPAAYRIFFYYGPKKDEITVISITPHP